MCRKLMNFTPQCLCFEEGLLAAESEFLLNSRKFLNNIKSGLFRNIKTFETSGSGTYGNGVARI